MTLSKGQYKDYYCRRLRLVQSNFEVIKFFIITHL